MCVFVFVIAGPSLDSTRHELSEFVFYVVALLKSLEWGCLSTIGLQRDGDGDGDEKTTVRSVPDGSDKHKLRKSSQESNVNS